MLCEYERRRRRPTRRGRRLPRRRGRPSRRRRRARAARHAPPALPRVGRGVAASAFGQPLALPEFRRLLARLDTQRQGRSSPTPSEASTTEAAVSSSSSSSSSDSGDGGGGTAAAAGSVATAASGGAPAGADVTATPTASEADAAWLAERLFRAFDTRGVGTLTHEQVVTGLFPAFSRDRAIRLRWLWLSVYDPQGRGHLTAAEVFALLDALPHGSRLEEDVLCLVRAPPPRAPPPPPSGRPPAVPPHTTRARRTAAAAAAARRRRRRAADGGGASTASAATGRRRPTRSAYARSGHERSTRWGASCARARVVCCSPSSGAPPPGRPPRRQHPSSGVGLARWRRLRSCY